MVRGNVMRVVLAWAGAAMAVVGCTCPDPNPPVTCADSVIAFEQPMAGATVDAPFDVSIVATAAGEAFPFESASLRVGGMSFTGTVSGNRATFTGVTAPAGAQELSASIAAGSCSKTATQSVTVSGATCTTPAVTAVSFPQDTGAPLGVLNRAELPDGAQLQVRVAATCVSGVQVRIKRGSTVVGQLTSFTNGVAVVSTSLPDADVATYELFAELVRDGQAVNQPTGAALGTIQVSRGAPGCQVLTTGTFGPGDDAEPGMAGFQMRVRVSLDATSSGSVVVNGETRGVTPDMTGEATADFTLTNSGDYPVTLTCTNAPGNMTTANGSFTLDFTPPTVTVTSPVATDGGSPFIDSSPASITVATEPGATGVVRINGNVVAMGTANASGVLTFQVPFGADGTYTLDITVTDAAGNNGTATLTVAVDLSGCGLVFTRPATANALLTPAQLSAGSYSFQTSSDPVCVGHVATLYRSDVLADGGVGAEQAVGNATLSAAGVGNFMPLPMSNGDFRFRAEVANPNDAGVSFASVNVTVDLDGPAITNPIVPTGQPAALITAVQDTAPGTAGVQRTLAFSARLPQGATVDVCITQAADAMGPLPTSAECGAGYFLLRQGVVSPVSGFSFPEGTYSMKIVVVGSGVTPAPASPPVSLVVDGTRPCVQGLTRNLPQDTNGDNRLNIAELAGGQPRIEFTLGCGDTSGAALAATGGVVVRDIVNGIVAGARASTTSFAGGVATVTLTDAYTTELDLNLFVELTDVVGNKNLLLPTNDPATFQFRVDPVAPTCTVTSPTQATLNIAQVPGGNLTVQIGTSADVSTGMVAATFTGQPTRSLTPNLNTASTTYALTGDSSYTIGATCADTSGNLTTATPRVTRVDLVAPTCAITTPANNATSGTRDVATTVTVGGVANGAQVTVASSVAGITNNILTVSGTTASGTVNYPNGAQSLTASVADDTGNPCTTAAVNLTVNSTSCSLAFAPAGPISTNASGSWLNRAGASLPVAGATPASASVAVGAVTSDCGAGKNVYLYAGAPSATPGGTPVVTNASGVVTFASQAFNEGAQYTVTIDNGAGQLTHRSFTVSLKAPTVAGITLQRSATVTTAVTVAKDAALVFGAAQGNRRVETATASDLVFGDLDATTADAQFQLALSNIDGANVGAFQAQLDVLEGAVTLLPTVPVTAAPFTPALPVLKLGHRADDAATSLVIRVTSPAGNVYTSTHAALVDVIAPAAPTVTRNLTSARAATVELQWAAVYDDGADTSSGGLTGGTPTAGYDVRWTTSSVPSNNSMAAASDYFGSASKADSVEAWQAGTITKALTLPPINSYFIAVRARDEVGNYSAFAAPASVANAWASITISNPGTQGTPSAHLFGQHVVSGVSLNNDAIADLIVAAPGRGATVTAGSVYIYWGGVAADTATCAMPSCQELRPYDEAAGLFGTDISVAGNVGDLAAEAKSDLVVGQPTFQSNVGRAFLYFGANAATLSDTNYVEFRGAAGINFASAARIIRDIDGDGLDEIAFSAHTESAGQGRLYIFKGRSADPAFNAGTPGANWFNSRTANDGNGNLFVPHTAATWVLTGPSSVESGGNQFARLRWGLISLGDINGDSRNDFLVPQSKDTATGNRAYIFSGATVSAAVAPVPTTSALQTVTSPISIANTATNEGFGRVASAGSFVGSLSSADLLISNPRQGRIYVYADLTSTGAGASPSATIQGAAAPWFGFHFTTCDLNADSRVDVLAGETPTAGGRATVVWQRTDGTFEPSVDGVTPAFWASTLVESTTNSRQGRMTGCADANGDGTPDVILGDEGMGRVRIYR